MNIGPPRRKIKVAFVAIACPRKSEILLWTISKPPLVRRQHTDAAVGTEFMSSFLFKFHSFVIFLNEATACLQ